MWGYRSKARELIYVADRIYATSPTCFIANAQLSARKIQELTDVTVETINKMYADRAMLLAFEKEHHFHTMDGPVMDYGDNCHFEDITFLLQICKTAFSWLHAQEKNVVILHCPRDFEYVGLVVSAFQTYRFGSASKGVETFLAYATASKQLAVFKQSLMLPSIARYLRLFDGLINLQIPVIKFFNLKSIEITCGPNKASFIEFAKNSPILTIKQGDTVLYSSKESSTTYDYDDDMIKFNIGPPKHDAEQDPCNTSSNKITEIGSVLSPQDHSNQEIESGNAENKRGTNEASSCLLLGDFVIFCYTIIDGAFVRIFRLSCSTLWITGDESEPLLARKASLDYAFKNASLSDQFGVILNFEHKEPTPAMAERCDVYKEELKNLLKTSPMHPLHVSLKNSSLSTESKDNMIKLVSEINTVVADPKFKLRGPDSPVLGRAQDFTPEKASPALDVTRQSSRRLSKLNSPRKSGVFENYKRRNSGSFKPELSDGDDKTYPERRSSGSFTPVFNVTDVADSPNKDLSKGFQDLTNADSISFIPPPPPPPPPPFGFNPPPPPPPPPPFGNVPPPPPPPPGFKAGGIPPPPPPPMGGAPPPPKGNISGPGNPPAIGLQRTESKAELKQLHWDTLPAYKLANTMWSDIGQTNSSIDLDLSKLEQLFSSKPNHRVAIASSSAEEPKTGTDDDQNGALKKTRSFAQKPKSMSVIDLKKANNVEIILSQIRVPDPVIEVRNIINSFGKSYSKISEELITSLFQCVPAKEDEEKLRAYKGDFMSLGRAERLMLTLMDISRIQNKLKIAHFIISFSHNIKTLQANISLIATACDEIKESKIFKKILQFVLVIGNTLNKGKRKGNAQGFKLDILPKLSTTKSNDNKTTLMHYLCELLISQTVQEFDTLVSPRTIINSPTESTEEPKLKAQVLPSPRQDNIRKQHIIDSLFIESELKHTEKACKISMQDLEAQTKGLVSDLTIVKSEIKSLEEELAAAESKASGDSDSDSDNDLEDVIDGLKSSLNTLKTFLEEAEGNITNTEKTLQEMLDRYNDMLLYYGEDPKSPFFQILLEFIGNFMKAREEVRKAHKL